MARKRPLGEDALRQVKRPQADLYVQVVADAVTIDGAAARRRRDTRPWRHQAIRPVIETRPPRQAVDRDEGHTEIEQRPLKRLVAV